MKIRAIHKLMLGVATLFLAASCSKDEVEPVDAPYVHIMMNETSQVNVNSNRKDVVAYMVYFSSKPIQEDLEVRYSVEVGDGLQAGRDFQLVTTENPLIFPSGIYQRPIQIRWLDNRVDPEKDNTIRIILESTNLDVSVGLPGPDNNQSVFTITKVNN